MVTGMHDERLRPREQSSTAFSYNFHVVVPHDAVYDRTPTVHQVNLFDMAQKYADVTSTDELDAELRRRHAAA